MKFLENLSVRKKQILILFIVSVFGAVAGIIHGIFFDLQWEGYWSATTFVPLKDHALYVDFLSGAVSANVKSLTFYVRCVR